MSDVKIELIHSQESAIVDAEDYHLVSQFIWHEHKGFSTRYAYSGYWAMHTLITGLIYVDHVNGNGLDNRRENLRSSNSSLNGANRNKQKNKTSSLYKGVFKQGSKWRATIGHNYRKVNLGLYDSEFLAALAYDKAAFEIWGEHAKLNFP